MRLILEDGTTFFGQKFAGTGEKFSEIVFNTAMSGYQEILTDPSYTGQMVLMTYPLIGNYGINDEDIESRKIFLDALLIREYIDTPSNWRSKKSLKTYLDENNILGVEGLDTRAITRHIRTTGAQRSLLTDSKEDIPTLQARIKASPTMAGSNMVEQVSTKEPYAWTSPEHPQTNIAVLDCGIKYNILRNLEQASAACTIFPADTDPETILSGNFDGLFISNGPGDPEPVTKTIETVKALLGKLPIFGICLGHQILALALGGKTYKLKFGHHGANHPVKNLKTGRVEITSQNHGFAVDPDSLNPDEIESTHINLFDGTNAGIRHKIHPAFSVQYHPEAGPGPHDSTYLFQEFIALIKEWRSVHA